jgi:hypothetical protein
LYLCLYILYIIERERGTASVRICIYGYILLINTYGRLCAAIPRTVSMLTYADVC